MMTKQHNIDNVISETIDGIEFRSFMNCDLVDVMGTDMSIIRAMLVSTRGDKADVAAIAEPEALAGRINFLIKNRHGTPFEHASMTFRISTPIFVIRELHRHRIGFSFNEESGRYKELDAVFYVPRRSRNLVQVGKPGSYTFVPGRDDQYEQVRATIIASSTASYRAYQQMLEAGIAKEVARMVLPVNIYSSQYVTCNPRSLMSFLSLRQEHNEEQALFPSKPMKEINMLADAMEDHFSRLFPVVHAAYVKNKRVAP